MICLHSQTVTVQREHVNILYRSELYLFNRGQHCYGEQSPPEPRQSGSCRRRRGLPQSVLQVGALLGRRVLNRNLPGLPITELMLDVSIARSPTLDAYKPGSSNLCPVAVLQI